MLYSKQFRLAILKPALEEINLHSPEAEEILVATMAHESAGGTYVVQKTANQDVFYNGGFGIYQIEKPTYQEVCNKLEKHLPLKTQVLKVCGFSQLPPIDEMIWNLKFATIIARINYMRFNEPLPPAGDLIKIWGYYKKYWNGNGKAVKEDFITNYHKFTA